MSGDYKLLPFSITTKLFTCQVPESMDWKTSESRKGHYVSRKQQVAGERAPQVPALSYTPVTKLRKEQAMENGTA